eukprot:6149031-Alexandrium_andersonii.AAC.1
MENGPCHVFGNILDFTCPAHRKKAGLDGGKEADPRELMRCLPRSRPCLEAWCHRHGKMCPITWTMDHRAGSPCVDFSSIGKRA